MFERFVLPGSTALFTIAAFAVAASIFSAVAWRAVKMRSQQTDRLARLPFETQTPESRDASGTKETR